MRTAVRSPWRSARVADGLIWRTMSDIANGRKNST